MKYLTRRPRAHTLAEALLLAAALAAIVFLLTGGDAHAASKGIDISDAGKNASDFLGGVAKALYVGIVGIMAVFMLPGRKLGPALVFAGLALVVGAFVFSPDKMGDVSQSAVSTLFGGGS